ncbi:MAG: type I 3-dehydroquinate dehydratase [Gloeobacteraceae cyanobacterium ES-bin-144]|nr:type I 3-dehydroquinate dehydratase [Verrucomicrobiales bacterium]
MTASDFRLTERQIQVVGSFGSTADLLEMPTSVILETCDIVEIRLDLIEFGSSSEAAFQRLHHAGLPLLFTARRNEEGGAGALSAEQRITLLEANINYASYVDIEVASILEMSDLLNELQNRNIPWIASFHDFEKLPNPALLDSTAQRAKDAGASAFKIAAKLHSPADLARLAEFQLADAGLPVATMGMGPLAPSSRLLCAQCGSVLNYGYLGNTPTAPGQWEAALLKEAITRLTAFRMEL